MSGTTNARVPHTWDSTIQILANGEADALERCADLERERDGYQLLARQALRALADLTKKLDSVTERHRRLAEQFRSVNDELRAYRQRRAA
jgi:hypothetical protein